MPTHADHFKIVCPKCGTIISQCRCASPDKRTEMVVCDACLHKHEPDAAPTLTNNEVRRKVVDGA